MGIKVLRVPILLSLYWTVVVDSVVTNTSVDFEALCFMISTKMLGTQTHLLLCASALVS